jgi:hypothetical protein
LGHVPRRGRPSPPLRPQRSRGKVDRAGAGSRALARGLRSSSPIPAQFRHGVLYTALPLRRPGRRPPLAGPPVHPVQADVAGQKNVKTLVVLRAAGLSYQQLRALRRAHPEIRPICTWAKTNMMMWSPETLALVKALVRRSA